MVVSAPGRVNLIGEHTDYSLLPVMPMAIDRGVMIAASADTRFEVHSDVEGRPTGGDPGRAGWQRYVDAVVDRLGYEGGFLASITSGLPPTGGLASSSALTMALLAALSAVAPGKTLTTEGIIEAGISAERIAGVESGAMDQTVIVHARAGSALRIDFDLAGRRTLTYVPIPETMRVVVAYSGTPGHKGTGARHAYNLAVVACRAATALLAEEASVPVSSRPVLAEVSHLDGVYGTAAHLPLAASAEEVARATGVDLESLVGLAASRFDPGEPLPIRASALHVLSEATRVDEAQRALVAADTAGLGRLLDLSHRSLIAFGASTAALDRVTSAMRAAGAHGARLTGAGYGGNAVAVCAPDRVAAVVEAAVAATGGPSFRVEAAGGLVVSPG